VAVPEAEIATARTVLARIEGLLISPPEVAFWQV
jgi:hypothetical protein